MTHYWWMHWFWITSWISLTICKSLSNPLHSNATSSPILHDNATDKFNATMTSKPPEVPTTIIPNVTLQARAPSSPKHYKTSQNKIEFLFPNATAKNKTKDDRDKDVKDKVKETVIKNANETFADDQAPAGANFTAINRTENLTYIDADVALNHSSVQNSERFGIDECDVATVSESNLSAAGITGITLGCVIVVGALSGISYFLYRNRGFNRPQVLNDRCSNPDSSGYIDDASVRDNSEEMYSLDNDSFLNSLEAMTIQNYWTDTVKHTKL
ncbi:unnamed protein product [Phyllotreta striolata]|uniref:Mid2 domain-containing protein n=1 Tax=Phyllotreta striolata TaxID=444603 RepID=A0A9N9TJH1_PHYSR|nr:unnamed protein product [Phyllotreta striolata]